MVGILVSFWDGLFSGAMLVSGSVIYLESCFNQTSLKKLLFFGASKNEFRKNTTWPWRLKTAQSSEMIGIFPGVEMEIHSPQWSVDFLLQVDLLVNQTSTFLDGGAFHLNEQRVYQVYMIEAETFTHYWSHVHVQAKNSSRIAHPANKPILTVWSTEPHLGRFLGLWTSYSNQLMASYFEFLSTHPFWFLSPGWSPSKAKR